MLGLTSIFHHLFIGYRNFTIFTERHNVESINYASPSIYRKPKFLRSKRGIMFCLLSVFHPLFTGYRTGVTFGLSSMLHLSAEYRKFTVFPLRYNDGSIKYNSPSFNWLPQLHCVPRKLWYKVYQVCFIIFLLNTETSQCS